MINRINFRMGSALSIPIYADWIKIRVVNPIMDDVLVISTNDGVPVSADIAMSELNLNYIIYVDDGVDFESVDTGIENINNAIVFDLYRKVMKIGYVDPLKLKEIDPWTTVHGIPVELKLNVGIFNDSNASNGISISATDSLGVAMFKHFDMTFGDAYTISNSNNIPTNHAIGLEANHRFRFGLPNGMRIDSVRHTMTDTKRASLILSEDAKLTQAVNMQSTYGNSMVLSSALLERLVPGFDLGTATNTLGLNGDAEIRMGVQVVNDDSGETYLVLHANNDVEAEIVVEEPIDGEEEFVETIDG